MLKEISLAIGGVTLAVALAAAPIDYFARPLEAGLKSALATPGNGNGKGQGNGQGAERSGNASAAGAQGAGGASGNGKANGLAKADGVSGLGQTPPGHAKKAAYDGVTGNLGIKGSFNSVHASSRAMTVASVSSRVSKVKSYLDAIQAVSEFENGEEVAAEELEGEEGEEVAATTYDSLESAVQAAAEAAAEASNHTVTEGMLDAVNGMAEVEVSDETNQEVADRAADIQAGGDGSMSASDGEEADGNEGGETEETF